MYLIYTILLTFFMAEGTQEKKLVEHQQGKLETIADELHEEMSAPLKVRRYLLCPFSMNTFIRY